MSGVFFVHRMTIRDISENGNQDKVALIVCDMKKMFKRHVGIYRIKKPTGKVFPCQW